MQTFYTQRVTPNREAQPWPSRNVASAASVSSGNTDLIVLRHCAGDRATVTASAQMIRAEASHGDTGSPYPAPSAEKAAIAAEWETSRTASVCASIG
jgi:hypothetical protein